MIRALLLVALSACASERAVRWEDVDPAATTPSTEARTTPASKTSSTDPPAGGTAPPRASTTPSTDARVATSGTTPSTDAQTGATTSSTDARAQSSAAGAATASTGIAHAPLTSTGPLKIGGNSVEDGGIVDMPALELVCIPAADALTEEIKVRARLDSYAEKLNVPLGQITFIVLQRDPARSTTDPPPHLCVNIPINYVARLKAPLFREKESASRWLVKRMQNGVVVDTAAVIDAGAKQKLAPAGLARVVVDKDGSFVAVALPVGAP